MSSKAKTKVFVDKDRNRMIFPHMIIYPGRSSPTLTDITLESMMFCTTLGLTVEAHWLEFDPDNLDHIVTEIHHRAFKHGGTKVLLIGGTLYNELWGRKP